MAGTSSFFILTLFPLSLFPTLQLGLMFVVPLALPWTGDPPPIRHP